MNKWIICPTCKGEGKHVNPSIDANGITSSEMNEDPEFMEDYFNGVYDIPCKECSGSGKVIETPEFWEERAQRADDRRLSALEDGDFESFSSAGDPRW